ncbi:MAG: hypothetical protein DWQ10_10220 [Calditrichaeota bacterium]|nr:MAG: hypothetical protein DWQ10_10220 [Calditrichota bacterium]
MNQNSLSQKEIFKFWSPLLLTWLMMAFEGPFLTAIIARLTDSTFNLAAYGVAYSFALIIEAPVIMIMTASTALIEDAHTFNRLRNFTYSLNILITVAMALLLVPAIFNFIMMDLIGLELKVTRLTHIALLILLPWPGAIGYRRFYQGILIRSHQTRKVAYGTVIRVTSMTLTAVVLYAFSSFQGAYVGAFALSVGVVLEALTARIMAHSATQNIRNKSTKISTQSLTYRRITAFYYPLALTSFLGLGVHPLVTFFVGQSRNSLESLAVLPVVNAIVFVFRAFGLSFQEVGVTYLKMQEPQKRAIAKFARNLAISASTGLLIIASPPAFSWWYETVSGLSPELAAFARIPTLVLILLPGLSVILSWQRSILVATQHTKPITMATLIEVCTIAVVLFVLVNSFDLVGATAAATAFLTGRILANSYMLKPVSLQSEK